MYRLVLSGYYGFGNAGDEAMLTAMLEAFGGMVTDLDITVLSGNPDDTRQRHGVHAIHRMDYPQIVRTLRGSDLLVSGGGSLLQDVTSDRSLYYYLSILLLAQKIGVPTMLYAQGIGPVEGRFAQKAMRYIGNRVQLITVRDTGSRQELERLGVRKPPVHVTADPVLALNPMDKMVGRHILKEHGTEPGARPLIGISVREWKGWDRYKKVLAAVADDLVRTQDARIVFLPMQWPEDLAATRKVAQYMQSPAVLLEDNYTTSELLSLVGNLDLLVGVRLHALIFAALMHVPFAGLSYDPKIDRFLESLGQSHVGTLQDITADALEKRLCALLREGPQLFDAVADKMHSLRDKALENAALALQVMEKKRSCER